MADFTDEEKRKANQCSALEKDLIERLIKRKASKEDIDNIRTLSWKLDVEGLKKAEERLNKNESAEAAQKAATAAANRLPTNIESMNKVIAIRERKREEEKRRKGI